MRKNSICIDFVHKITFWSHFRSDVHVQRGFISSLILIEWKVLTRSLSVLHWVSWRPSLVVSYGTGLGWFLKQETGEHCKSWKCLLLLLMIWQSPGLPGWRKVNFITVTRRPHHPNIAAGLYYLDTSPGFLPTLCVKWSGSFTCIGYFSPTHGTDGLKHKDSFGKSENFSKIFFAEILVFDHDYEGKSSSSNGLLWISFIFFK